MGRFWRVWPPLQLALGQSNARKSDRLKVKKYWRKELFLVVISVRVMAAQHKTSAMLRFIQPSCFSVCFAILAVLTAHRNVRGLRVMGMQLGCLSVNGDKCCNIHSCSQKKSSKTS